MKFSLREILGLSAFIAISLASMRMGGVLAGAMIVGICLLATALLIVAFVVRDIRRAWAIGFLVPVSCVCCCALCFRPTCTESL